MNKFDGVMYVIVIFLSWIERTFLLSKYEIKRRKAYARWYKRQSRLCKVERAGKEYWNKYGD